MMELSPELSAEWERKRERFWSRIIKTEDMEACWDWDYYSPERGYGTFWFGEKHKQSTHLVWLTLHGKLPEPRLGELVLHKCDRPVCCNPSHLFIGTVKDNAHDMIRKGRKVTRRGSYHKLAKLNESDVIEILDLLYDGHTHSALAKVFSVNIRLIWAISKQKAWPHITKSWRPLYAQEETMPAQQGGNPVENEGRS